MIDLKRVGSVWCQALSCSFGCERVVLGIAAHLALPRLLEQMSVFLRGFAGVGGMLLIADFRMLLEVISLAPFRLDCCDGASHACFLAEELKDVRFPVSSPYFTWLRLSPKPLLSPKHLNTFPSPFPSSLAHQTFNQPARIA